MSLRSSQSDEALKNRLLNEVSEVRASKKELEEQLEAADLAQRLHSDQLRKQEETFQQEVARLRRDSQAEIRQLVSQRLLLYTVVLLSGSVCKTFATIMYVVPQYLVAAGGNKADKLSSQTLFDTEKHLVSRILSLPSSLALFICACRMKNTSTLLV